MENLKEVKAAVDNNKKVCWKNPAYQVIKSASEYMITCEITNFCVILTEDYNSDDFYTAEEI